MKAIKHFILITHHRHQVIKNAFKAGIWYRGLLHDLSKYSFAEFIPSASHYLGVKSATEGERLDYGYSKAWLHHKGRNKHHFEYWFDVSPVSHKYEPVKMPLVYLKEMFCDRVAATKTYLKDKYTDASPYNYFMSKTDGSLMHKDTCELLLKWLTDLKDYGEKYTFKEIRETKSY